MKEDITQLLNRIKTFMPSWGLVMKEDITQQRPQSNRIATRCGLVMKEDITQQHQTIKHIHYVVVW